MFAFNWFFLQPVHTLTLADSRNWFALAVYVVTAIVVSDLAARSRRRAREAELLTHIARTLLERGSVSDDIERIAASAAAALRVADARIDLSVEPVPEAEETGWPLDAAGRRVGMIFLRRPFRGSVAARRHVVPALASMLAVAIDRERLANEVVEAEALRRSDSIKTAVLRAVSHDLRSPLMAIATSAGTLSRFDATLSDTDKHELLETILIESERLDHLVANLLDLSKLQAGVSLPQRRSCSAGELVERAIHELSEGKERIEIDVGAAHECVTADPGQVERVLVNLVENALKYSPADTPVRVTVTRDGQEVVIRVDDSGPGLTAPELERVFAPFERGASAGNVRGAGLGLAIARGFAEANEGRLWVEQGPLGGASFVLALPRDPARVEVPA
jgi:two-component system sensor histidine kinase KdpD